MAPNHNFATSRFATNHSFHSKPECYSYVTESCGFRWVLLGSSGSGSFESWCSKGTDKFFPRVNLSLPLSHHDPGSLILIHIISKERILWVSLAKSRPLAKPSKCVRQSAGRVKRTFHTRLSCDDEKEFVLGGTTLLSIEMTHIRHNQNNKSTYLTTVVKSFALYGFHNKVFQFWKCACIVLISGGVRICSSSFDDIEYL